MYNKVACAHLGVEPEPLHALASSDFPSNMGIVRYSQELAKVGNCGVLCNWWWRIAFVVVCV